jgi:hypothetical protein
MIEPNPNSPTVHITANSVEDQPASVAWHGKEHQYNLSQILSFKEDIEEATATHSQRQSYWETLAIEVASKCLEFEEIGYAKWFSHARRYAHLVMHALNVKETLEASKDWVIILFSGDLSDLERDAYAETAYRGWIQQRLGTATKAEAYLAKAENPEEYPIFRQGMLGYLAAGWTYERVQRTLRELKEQKLKVEKFAQSMNDRSFKMREFQQIQMAKHGNVNPFKPDEMRKNRADSTPPTGYASPPSFAQSSGRIKGSEVDDKSMMESMSRDRKPNQNPTTNST